MLADPALSWSQLAGVVYGLVLEGRETESGRGPTDLFALADSLAIATGGAVTIEDQLSRVLAYSGPQEEVDAARLETIMRVGEDPPDDGVAEPGMVLTVRFDDTGETETFLLGARGAEHGTIEVYYPDSPLGAAVNGARRGERRAYRTPSGVEVSSPW